ncbi:MAG: hypothetical protein AB7I30_11650 [Isosphaeraceae bacterium]
MSQTTETATVSEHRQLEKLCVAIRGKLQFMDYLVRAALADVERHQEEPDAGTRIFIRQLIEMHATNLSSECENMRLISEFSGVLQTLLDSPPADTPNGDDR